MVSTIRRFGSGEAENAGYVGGERHQCSVIEILILTPDTWQHAKSGVDSAEKGPMRL